MPIILEILKNPDSRYGLKGTDLFNEHRMDKDILKTMNENTYEELVTSWAYWCLKNGKEKKYEDVFRIGGAGDGGIDVIAYYDIAKRDCDIYQCKHYNHPVNRSDVIAELGKFLFNVYKGEFQMPREYFLVAPQGLSGPFNKVYSFPDRLKQTIKDSWNKDIAGNIESKIIIKLEGDFLKFVDEFDYKKFKLISTDKLLEDIHQRENRHVYFQYFGYKKNELERVNLEKPTTHQDYEANYIHHLVDAYNDVDGVKDVTPENVGDCCFASHFEFSRDEFWMAESVRKMSEENCPGDTDEFKELENDMLHHVVDTYNESHKNALERVKAVTRQSTSMPKKENRIISGELSSGELKGVCFQLSNENKLIWKDKEKS